MLALVLLGCATERPTETTKIPELLAVSISSPLVTDSSEWIIGHFQTDSTYSITLGNTELFTTSTIDDIHLTFEVCHGGTRSVISVYDYSSNSWMQCVASVLNCGGTIGPVCFDGTRLISQVPGDVATSRLDSQGRLSLLLPPEISDVRAQLVRYIPVYQFATLFSDRACRSHLWFAKGALYALTSDTLVALDLEGTRRWTVAINAGETSQAAFDGDYIWIHDLSVPQSRLLKVDTLGSIVASIADNRTFVDGIVWVDGRLWYVVGDGFIEIDLDSSLALGEVVTGAVIRVVFPSGLFLGVTADSVGPIVAIAKPNATLLRLEPWVFRYTFDGIMRDSFKFTASVKAIAWDGETLWTLHHGPTETRTDATLLTRFTLE